MNLKDEITKNNGRVTSLVLDADYASNPLTLFHTLSQTQPQSLLLESAEIASKHNEKSLLLVDASLKVRCMGQEVELTALTENGQRVIRRLMEPLGQYARCEGNQDALKVTFSVAQGPMDEDQRLKSHSPFSILREIQALEDDGRSEFGVFLGGLFSYDMLGVTEQLPDVPCGDNPAPDYLFYLAETLIVIDHKNTSTQVIGNVVGGEHADVCYLRIAKRLGELKAMIEHPLQDSLPQAQVASPEVSVNLSDEAFKAQVTALKQHIVDGDIFQVVPSRTFSLACPSPMNAYAALKQQNPSPYMFYFNTPEFALFGASPESALKYDSHTKDVEVYPIAGTRPRGRFSDGRLNPDLDSRIELELRNDHKERAEHLMLVDLARNDIARVSEPGTRHVAELLKVDRYSHVMHLVSRVKGHLRQDLDALHAYQASMNMGTLVGAPKIRAAELVRETEKQRRGSYGGAVGYLTGRGDMDTCIVIRSALVHKDIAYVQAGAGVVFDSDPQAEADETRNKAQAVVRAIQSAHKEA